MNGSTSAEWRGPQHEDDTSIGADDGTRWTYAEGLNIWSGWQPGEDGLWENTPEEMRAEYPEVVEHWLDQLATRTRQLVDAATGNAATGYTDETRAAVLRLTDAVADDIGEETLAQWVVTRWLITRQPIRDCITAELPRA